MQKKLQRLFLTGILLFSSIIFPLYATDGNLSKTLFDTFHNKAFSTKYQGLAPSDSSKFPQNIIIQIPAAKATEEETATVRSMETVVFAFTQEYVAGDRDGFASLADRLAELRLPYTLELLLSANDVNRQLPRDDLGVHPTGTDVFAAAISTESDSTCAVVFEAANGSTHAILPGGAGDISPLWLVRALKTACSRHNRDSQLPNAAAFLYRLGFVNENRRVSSFLAQSIPAAGFTIGHSDTDYNILCTIATELANADSQVWDRHYSYVHIPILELEFWLNETYFAFCYLLLAVVILFSLCFTSIARNQRNLALFKDLGRSWYAILLLVLFTTGTLQATQTLFSSVRQSTLLLGYKLIATFLATLLLFILQTLANFRLSYQASSYSLLFVTAANIFLFCAIDLSFLFLFFFEYLICYATKGFKKTLALIAISFLMLPPFLSVAANILFSSGPRSLRKFAAPSPIGNFLIACIIFPFQLQSQRILMSLDIFNRQQQTSALRRLVYSTVFVLVSILVFSFTYFFLIGKLLSSSFQARLAVFPSPPERRIPFEEDGSRSYVHLSLGEEEFMEFKLHHVLISCDEDISILRYEISVEAPGEVPLYDCNYNYTIAGENKAYLLLPDNPEGDIAIIYSSELEQIQTISLATYLQTPDGRLILERDEFRTAGGS